MKTLDLNNPADLRTAHAEMVADTVRESIKTGKALAHCASQSAILTALQDIGATVTQTVCLGKRWGLCFIGTLNGAQFGLRTYY